LEGRWLWGNDKLFDEAMRRFRREVVASSAAEFVGAKLAERDARHVRMGDTRYVVEPNVKDGKGGLRDLHTLYWIGKYVHGVERPADLVAAGLLTSGEFRRFDRAERFFWAVRSHLHLLAGRAEERLSFEYQPRIAEIMHYADRPGKSAVERFMQFYFLNAKAVGDLTGLFLAQLDEQLAKKGFRFALPTIRRRPKRLGGFVLDRGRVVAQMQFDMYHHYTVDEHSIRAIGLLAAIERGELKQDHPVSTAIIKQIASRRVLYVAVLLHDIAKGRGGDHSEIGAEIALELCPRFGLDPAETETVSWLVRYHLLLSSTAFKRDLADPKTIEDFVGQVQSPERLRLLLILTVVDIRAVGPGVWNDWKRTLLRTLFEAAEERLRLGHKQHGRTAIVERRQQELAAQLGWKRSAARAHARRLPDSYWLAEPPAW